jgi:hypothetical protein
MITLESFFDTFQTGSGFWNPITWIIVIIITSLITLILRGFGKKEYKEKTEQTKSFLSGNPEYKKEQMHIKGSNVYWGFLESLKGIFNALEMIHTGNVSDYVLSFVIIIAILFIVIGAI